MNKIIALVLFIILAGTVYLKNQGSSDMVGTEMLSRYSAEVGAAYSASFEKLQFPPNADDEYKATQAGMLIGCLDNCMTPTQDSHSLYAAISHENCKPACECIVNKFMPVHASQMNLPPEQQSLEAGTEGTRVCIEQHKRSGYKFTPR